MKSKFERSMEDYVDKFYKTTYNDITNTCKTTTQI